MDQQGADTGRATAGGEEATAAGNTIIYPTLPEDLARGFGWRSIKYFGAGAIVASVTIGSGETLFAARGGAIFGYTLLWCFVGGAFLKGVQVYAAARHMTLTGEHPMTHWAAFPGPRAWVPVALGAMSIACFPFWHAGLPLALGTAMNWILGIRGSQEELLFYARSFGTINIVLIVVLTWLQSYGFLERAQSLIVGVLLVSMLAAVFAARPDWTAVLAGMAVPRIPKSYEPWVVQTYESVAARPPWVEIVTYLGAVGGGTYDYIGYIGCYREKAWGALAIRADRYRIKVSGRTQMQRFALDSPNLSRAKAWLLPAKVDVGMSFMAVAVFAASFAILGALVLHPAQTVPEGHDLLSHQAQFLTRISPTLLVVYQIGIFFAFWGTIYGAYEIYIRTAFECLAPTSRRVRTMSYRRFRLTILLYSALGGLALLWTMDDPIEIVTPAALLGGVFACGMWCYLMIWADRRFLPHPLRMPPFLLALVALAGTILILLGTKAIWDWLMF